MPSTSAIVFLNAWGEPRTAEWCSHCALPSVVELDVVISDEKRTLNRCTVSHCTECGHKSIKDVT